MEPEPLSHEAEVVVAFIAFIAVMWFLFAIEASAIVAAVASMAVPFATIYLVRFVRRQWYRHMR